MVKNQVSSTPNEQQQASHLGNSNNKVANDGSDEIIENPAVEVSRDVFRLDADIKTLTIRVDKRLITKNIQESLGHFRRNFDNYFEGFKSPVDQERVLSAGRNISTYGESIGHVLNRFSSLGFENRRLAQQIIQRSRSINNTLSTQKDGFLAGLKTCDASDLPSIETTPANANDESETQPEVDAFDVLAKNLMEAESKEEQKPEPPASVPQARELQLPSETLSHAVDRSADNTNAKAAAENKALQQQLAKRTRQIQALAARAKKSEDEQNERLQSVKAEYAKLAEEADQAKDTIKELREAKDSEIDDEIIQEFDAIAEEEHRQANFYRYSAFGYLAVFLSLTSYLFIGVSFAGFDWVKTTVRALIACSLLAPFAYAARESKLHRQQQNCLTRDALKLKATGKQQSLLDSAGKSYADYQLMKNAGSVDNANKQAED